MSVGLNSACADSINPRNGTAIAMPSVYAVEAGTAYVMTAAAGPGTTGTVACALTAFTADPTMTKLMTSAFSFYGGSGSHETSRGLDFALPPHVPRPANKEYWPVQLIVNGDVQDSYATLDASGLFSFNASLISSDFVDGQPSSVPAMIVEYNSAV